MQLKTFFFAMTALQRKELAHKAGTSVGHLTNACYRYTTLNAAVCVALERESNRMVTRQELRPDDWQSIWPELSADIPAP